MVVIGAGIAGAAAAWHLAGLASVVMVERETHAGAHATGRSAALHTRTSGAPVVGALAAASRPFLAGPPEGFTDHGLLSPRGLLWIARHRERDPLERKAAEAEAAGVEVHRLDGSRCRDLVGVLRPPAAAAGVYAAVPVLALFQFGFFYAGFAFRAPRYDALPAAGGGSG